MTVVKGIEAASFSPPSLYHGNIFCCIEAVWSVYKACCDDNKALGILSDYFTYVIRFQLHSAAEDKSVEVGLLEDLVEGSFVLKLRNI